MARPDAAPQTTAERVATHADYLDRCGRRVLAAEVRQLGEIRDALDLMTDAALLAAHYLLDYSDPGTNAHRQAQVTLMVARDAAELLGKPAPCEVCGTTDPTSSGRHHRHLRAERSR